MVILFCSQFVIVESFISTVSDLFPKLFRAPVRHKIFVLVICVSSFLIHLTMVTEVNKNIYINSFKSIKFPKSEYVSFINEFQKMCFTSYLFLIQGGIYIFQLVDFYGSTRMCRSFMAICECLAIGWIVGEFHHISLKPSGWVISIILSLTLMTIL